MKILIFLALLCVSFAHQESECLAPLKGSDHPAGIIEGEFIVIFKKEMKDNDIDMHKTVVRSVMKNKDANFNINHEWDMGMDFRGYAGVMDDSVVEEIRRMKEVDYVEHNRIATTASKSDASAQLCMYQVGDTDWGLTRTFYHQEWQSSYRYFYNPISGLGVTIFVIDSGIDLTHPLLAGRVYRGADYAIPAAIGDPLGHGTHVAGIAMADTYGMARGAVGCDVRVINNLDQSTTAQFISGLNYVSAARTSKSVVNMSLKNGGVSIALNMAVKALVDLGVHVVVAAGNDNIDACEESPASEPLAVTVAASDINDQKPWFSNYGTCVDLIAPGVNINSTVPGGGADAKSGTSMAAPHVAGAIASILSQTNGYDLPANMTTLLIDIATKNAITGFRAWPQTANNLLYYNCFL